MKTTDMQMPMDYLEIPEPALPRGFLKLAEEARNVKVESGRSCYTEEVQSQRTGLTRPVFVTVVEYSLPVLKKGAVRAAGVSTEMIPTRSSTGRCKPVDQSGLVGPQNQTDQPVLPGSDADQVGTVPTGPVGPDIIIDRRKPVDQSGLVGPQNQTDQPVLPGSDADQVGTVPTGPVGPDVTVDRIQPVAEGPVGQYITRRPVGPDVTVDRIQPVAEGPVGQYITRRPVGPDEMFSTSDSDQTTDDGPVGQFITRSPGGSDRMLFTGDADRPVADGPVGQSFILGPVGPRRMFSLYKLNQPVAVGPVGQPFTTGPMGTHERVSDCKRMDRIADSPVGSTEILDPVKQTESPIQTDFMKIGTINEPASLGDTPPSSDSGVHSWGEQWENMSTSSIDMEPEQNERPTNGSAIGRRVSDNRVPEKYEDINYPLTDCFLNEESDENSSIDIQQNGRKIQYHICHEENSSVNSGTDGGNSDIGVLADFSDDEVDPRYTPEMIRRINEMGFRSDEDEYTPQWEHEFQQTIAVHVDISDIDFPDGEDSEIVDRRVRELMTAQTERNTNFPNG